MINKLKSEKGESIGEVLVAMLIVALGSVMFASMVTASGRLLTHSKQAYNSYIENHNQLESESTTASAQQVKIEKLKNSDPAQSDDCIIGNIKESVKVYVSSDQKKFIYEYDSPTTGAGS